ncbi:hypothetical protein EDD11_008754 [Mortierella claussenii]|nr:hypothetical protein EDD11_008754 [Mortierella claussenii]
MATTVSPTVPIPTVAPPPPPSSIPSVTTPPVTTPPVPSTTQPLPSSVVSTTQEPAPTQAPDPTSTTAKGPKPKPTTSARSSGGNASSTASIGPSPTSSNSEGDGSNGSGGGKSIIGPVIGGIAGVLVVAFLVAVFVMRYKKKSRARKRRLDFLGDHGSAGPGTAAALGGAGAGAGAGAGTGARPTSAQNSAGHPSSPGGGRPLEMAAVGAGGVAAASHPHNDGYDYQQGYQQVPYGSGGYPDQYDQYDPYYAQRQQQQQGQAYYADQQQGYYAPDEQQQHQQYQNQFAAPAVPMGAYSQGTGSPSMTHATASPKSYPQPPPSATTGGHSSPRTPLQNAVPVPVPGGASYDKNAKVESGYAGMNSSARNPQLVPENEERIKVPM